MFGVGTPEMIGIVLVIFLIYGPDKLPEMIKKVAGFIRQIKSMTDDVTNSVSKEIHRIERSVHFEEPKHLIERPDPNGFVETEPTDPDVKSKLPKVEKDEPQE